MTTISDFNDAKALWRHVLDEWTIKCVQWSILYVHRSTNKVLPAFDGISASNPTTPESALQFHMEKKRKAFHLGFIVLHTSESTLTEEAAKEFISMTAYLRDTHQLFVQPCVDFLHGGTKHLDGHRVEFKALDDYKGTNRPGLNSITATTYLVRSRVTMGYYPDAQTSTLQHVPEENAKCEEHLPVSPGAQNSLGARNSPGAQNSPDLPSTPVAPVVEVEAKKARFEEIKADKSLKTWKNCSIVQVIPALIDKGLKDDQILDGCAEIQAVTESISPNTKFDQEHLEMAVSSIEKHDNTFFASCNSNEDRWQKIKDSITPNKVTEADQVREYDKRIGSFKDLGETPEMRHMLDNQRRKHNNEARNLHHNNEARNLHEEFNAAKTPNSNYMLSNDTSEDNGSPVQQQRRQDEKGEITTISNLMEKVYRQAALIKRLKQENKELKRKRGRPDYFDTAVKDNNTNKQQYEERCSELERKLKEARQKNASPGSLRARHMAEIGQKTPIKK